MRGQANLTPKQAALYWVQLHDFANSFKPPLTLVGPGMTRWGEDGGSPWLDQFFGHLTEDHIRSIKFLAQHDYSGNAKRIIAKADAAYKKYGKKVYNNMLTAMQNSGSNMHVQSTAGVADGIRCWWWQKS